MSRLSFPPGMVLLAAWLTATTGCLPQQPFYFFEDGDLSHYVGVATDIEYPDVESYSLDEVEGALPPLTLSNPDPTSVEDLALEEAVRIALENSKVMRNLGGVAFGPNGSQGDPSGLLSNPDGAGSVYSPGLAETDPRFGVEAALAAFDAQFTSSVFWEKNDTPFNVAPAITFFRPDVFEQDLGTFQAQLSKTTAPGGTFALRQNVRYESNNTSGASRRWPSDWNVNLEAEFRQPWLQGFGVQYNRIAGLGAIPGYNAGVMIARLRTDLSLADFEAGVRNLASDVERGYWNLYYAYRRLNAVIAGRDHALRTWRTVRAKQEVGHRGGGKQEEAQARQQYYLFRGSVEQALSNLYKTENLLRYIMGLAATDGRLFRPSDEPTTAKVNFDWYEIHSEAMARAVELRKQKWRIKQRELELIAAKNYLLPRLDTVGRYRWLGLGDDLIDTNNSSSNAYGSMTDGRFQEWQLGLELRIPLGFRKERAGVRNAELNLARERAILQEQELELSHQLADAIRDLDENYALSQTNFNRRVAAQSDLDAAQALVDFGQTTVDLLLDAQRRLAEAENDYYRSLVDYNLGITQLHFRKGSLLEYNGVHLTEGPWPGKAYFDAHRRARARDASFYLDYGFTRPKVISQGPYNQHAGAEGMFFDEESEYPTDSTPELIPTPEPMPIEQPESTDESAWRTHWPEVSQTQWIRVPAAKTNGKENANPVDDKYDLVSYLDVLALGPPVAASAPAAERNPVQPVDDQQASRPVDVKETNPSTGRRKSLGRSSTTNEPDANLSSAEIDRPASSWKRVQH